MITKISFIIYFLLISALLSFGDLTENHKRYRNPAIRFIVNTLFVALMYGLVYVVVTAVAYMIRLL